MAKYVQDTKSKKNIKILFKKYVFKDTFIISAVKPTRPSWYVFVLLCIYYQQGSNKEKSAILLR